jgi:hypothetical protein
MSINYVWCIRAIEWNPSVVTRELEGSFNVIVKSFGEWELHGKDTTSEDALISIIEYLDDTTDPFNQLGSMIKDLFKCEVFVDYTNSKTIGDVLKSAISKFVFHRFDLDTELLDGQTNCTVWHIENKPDAKGYQGFMESTFVASRKWANESKFTSLKKDNDKFNV